MKKFITMVLAVCLILVPTLSGLNSAHAAGTIPNEVSVKLKYHLKDKKTIPFEIKGTYQQAGNSDRKLSNTSFEVKVNGSVIELYEQGKKIASYSNQFEINPVKYGKENYIRLNGRPYLGSIRFTIEKGYLVPVNTLPMEDYLKGVLPSEIYPSWHMEALKAQAVAARTYALKKIHYNIVMTDDVGSQRYDGYIWWDDAKYANTNEAVDTTKGQVLTYKDALIDAVFSSNNGGYIESNKGAWPSGSQLDYLKAKKDDYDPAYDWGLQFKETQINSKDLDLTKPQDWWNVTNEAGIKKPLEKEANVLNNLKNTIKANHTAIKDAEIKIVTLKDVAVSNTLTPGQRRTQGSFTINYFVKNKDGSFVMEEVEVDGKKVTQIKMHSWKQQLVPIATMRNSFGLNDFKSHFVTSINLKDGVYDVKGKGWGHGVGMSQYGAKKMAEIGKTYKEILGFYYEGTAFTNYITSHINNSLSGENRYETSVAIAEYGWANFQNVVIGRGDNPVDALTGSVLAKKHDAPLLLIKTNEIPQAVKELLSKQTIHEIYVLGGQEAVSNGTVSELQKYATKVTRVQGANRYETSVEVAKQIGSSGEVIITSGKSNSPDALSIASHAALNQVPILFTKAEELSTNVRAYLAQNNISKVTVIGGDAAVSVEVEEELKTLAGNVKRVSGADRYATSIAIVKEFNLDPRNLFFARGEQFIDALPGSVLAANMEAPLLLTKKDELPLAVKEYLDDSIHFVPAIHYLGGTSAITNDTRQAIQNEILK